MFLGGYYVQSTMGGVSMEASCETGLCAGLAVAKKYNTQIIDYPIYHQNQYITPMTKGLCYIDKLLYQHNLPKISKFIPPIILILLYFISIVIITIIIIKKVIFR
jgi:hypothetical protein